LEIAFAETHKHWTHIAELGKNNFPINKVQSFIIWQNTIC